jgi:hypothetical protein
MMQTTDDNADDNAATQMTGNNADNDNAAADVNATMQTNR